MSSKKLINWQAHAITGMYPSILIAILMNVAGLILANILPNFCQYKYAYCILGHSDLILKKEILPSSLQIGDGNPQSEDQPEEDLIWLSS